MDEQNRQRMLAWARRARANPKFDLQERDGRLAAARLAAEALDAAARDEPIADRIASFCSYTRPRLHPEFLVRRQLAQLDRWGEEDESGLARALRVFGDPDLSPEQRVGRFADAFQRRVPGEAGAITGITLGSLFNFARSPGELPIVRPGVFRAFEGTLGEPTPDGGPAGEYAHHLAFARKMHETFQRAGLPVRDMVDTEALILTCWEDREFWAEDDDGRRPRTREPDHYLAACAIYRDEAAYLAEWIEFHTLVGFERFYLYDNFSSDHHLEALEPYIREGRVVLHDWPRYPGQFEAYDHCVANHGEEARWIGFFDIDEFVFSPSYRPVSEILADYEQWPGVCVNVPRFGTAGHKTRPEGLVIENYTVRLEALAEQTVKSIVDPTAVDRCLNAHEFSYIRRSAVDTDGFPVHGTASKSAALDRLRANHYYSKSEEELRSKHARRTADYAAERRPLPDPGELARRETELGVRDETILHYAGRLREALSARAGA